MIKLNEYEWQDHPLNPLIHPPGREWMIADPTVMPPEKTPDAKWHLFANSLGFIRHYLSGDGIKWEISGNKCFQGIRPYLYVEQNRFFLLYEWFRRPWRSSIAVRSSHDLFHWSDPVVLLDANKDRNNRCENGKIFKFIGNPCLVRHKQKYRLYFSYDWTFLSECLYFEPRFVGIARADSIYGPYKRTGEPLIEPNPLDPYRNLGAGSVKFLADDDKGWWVLNNEIFRNKTGRASSAIRLLYSPDGVKLFPVSRKPIIAPEKGWKKAFVYACCPLIRNDELYVYYNARDGWFKGAERIGLSIGKRRRNKAGGSFSSQ